MWRLQGLRNARVSVLPYNKSSFDGVQAAFVKKAADY